MDAAAVLSHGESTQGRLSTGPSGRISTTGFQPDILRAPPRVRLVHLARESASTCPSQPRVKEFRYQGDGPFPSHELQSVLTFSYGSGTYTLERIYELLRQDILYCSLITTALPHPNTLRAFRRMERASVISSLETFFRGVSELVEEERRDGIEPAAWYQAVGLRVPLENSPEAISKLVVDRINQATWTDKMLQDF